MTHPGAHTGSGCPSGIERVAEALNRLFAEGVGGDTIVLLENTAGQGSCLGGRLEELAWIIERVSHPERVGVCIDTCHLFAAGYDIRAPEGYHATMDRLISLLGSERIKAFHVNDSQGQLGSHLDRHAAIGEGQIGVGGFALLVNDPRFESLPMILETPKEPEGADIRNLTLLRSLRRQASPHPSIATERPA